jgi:hypothetical protein
MTIDEIAAQIFRVPVKSVTDAQREHAKRLTLGMRHGRPFEALKK